MLISKITRWVRQLIGDILRNDGLDPFIYDGNDTFRLSESNVVESSITVYLQGEVLSAGNWSYNSDTNEVVIDITESGILLVNDDIIEITYNFYCKYSDVEISGYIEGSLLYFTEARYCKTFEVDDEDNPLNILAVNGIDPTTEEGHLIALVTAIHINPDNQTIRTPDLTISGKQFKSKKEQITNTIARFSRFVGSLEFLED